MKSVKKRALISVFIKDGILDLAQFLIHQEWEILSTGGTAAYLTKNGIAVTDVSTVTGFPECLDGRVKTLHPKIHAGLLAQRNNSAHMQTLQELDVNPIDLVCVNLYPFFEKVQANLSFEQTVEFIDIGGPTMLRSAAKNFSDVIVLTDPEDYVRAIEEIRCGKADTAFRRTLAGKVFNLTSAYDAAVSRFMLSEVEFPAYFTQPLVKATELMKNNSLRYGENAHQKAALYITADTKGAFGGMTQLQGKELSYNNIRDLDIAWKTVCAYNKQISDGTGMFTVALKHNTPCGAAVGKTLLESYKRTYICDPVSIFGGIIGCSIAVDRETAEEMVNTFLEAVVAPDFTAEALSVFAAKKNVRLIKATVAAVQKMECLSVDGGLLVQERDMTLCEKWDVVTTKKPTQEQLDEMTFGMTIAQFAKSNAIVIIKNKTAIGIGCGQTNRIWATEQALDRAQKVEKGATVLISDAFFPFADCVRKAAEYGITAIMQPGGSIRDNESIDACNELGIAMVCTGTRHFKH